MTVALVLLIVYLLAHAVDLVIHRGQLRPVEPGFILGLHVVAAITWSVCLIIILASR